MIRRDRILEAKIKQGLAFALLYSIFLLFPVIVRWITPDSPPELISPIRIMVLWALPLFAFIMIKDIFNRIVAFFWLAWFIVGSVNILASYQIYGSHYLVDVEFADLVYIIFSLSFFLGILVYENRGITMNKYRSSLNSLLEERNLERLDPLFSKLLIAFPFIWFGSLYYFVGDIPIFRGVNITEDIYKINYGPLYGFGLINVLSMLVVLQKSRSTTSVWLKWLYWILLIVFAIFSIADGKRYLIMILFFSIIPFLLSIKKYHIPKMSVAMFVIFVVILYVGTLLIRQGLNLGAYPTVASQLSLVGDEFRDFVYSVNHFEATTIEGYQWAISAIVAPINSKLLSFIGINKQEVVYTGSAYVWKSLFNSKYGIRTGIISELYFAYEFAGIVPSFLFGVLTAWISTKLRYTKSINSLMFLSVVYGLLLLSVVGQTTATTGLLGVLFYAWSIFFMIRFPIKIKRTYNYNVRFPITK